MDHSISKLMEMQQALHKIHEHEWFPLEPEYGRHYILFMIEEIGETIAILKKKGDRTVLDDPEVRSAFLEEMADVLMYYTDTLLRFHVTPDEISQAYSQKYICNMGRNFTEEYKEKYHGKD